MTNQTNLDASADVDNGTSENGNGDLFNTAAGWVLFAAGLGLGLSILSGKYFHGSDPQRPEQLGYVIEGVEETGGKPAEMTMAEALTLVTAAQGEKVYAKCAACHTITPGGANGVGPNLNNIMGSDIGTRAGYAYSAGMSGKDGQWGWDEMNEWLKKPSSYVEGTKMSFAGLSKIEDRAAVALFMNGPEGTLPLPEFTPAEVETAEEGAEADTVATAEAEQNAAEGTSEQTAEAES
ncbi:MAG: cytochrome c family protein [Pseudomonadota bacterium]